ncbi:MAG TPA: hypothetical protein PLJ78_17700 [Anaerolineae bacterium]|nr:hypothetical protein [Anaerolineae bacterium]HQK15767.1 hypothetical protein [Anaerolineae bacterium]
MEKAKTLAEVIRLFDPRQPLRDETLQFYIDRPRNPLQKLETYLRGVALAGKPVKVLFTGHVGSGKSTELNKLSERLGEEFFIVRLDVQESLNLADLEAVDILLGLLTALVRSATAEKVLRKAPRQIAAEVWEDVRLFIRNRMMVGQVEEPKPPVASEVALNVNVLAVQFESKFSQEASTREEIRKQMRGREAELTSELNFVLRQVRDKYGHPILFLIEGTDKPNLVKARDLFLNYARTLTAFETAAIYTFPIGLRYSPDFTVIKDAFDGHYILPNINVEKRNGGRDNDGLDYLESAIAQRADLALFDTEALRTLTFHSGGLMRTLIRMVQGAAVNALSTGGKQIGDKDVQVALNEEKADYIAALKASDYAVLADRMRDKDLSSDPAVQELLHSRALLEYANGEPWCDVHPVIRDLVRERAKVEDCDE